MKTGADHIHSVRDGRQIYLDGQLVDDVVEHPAYRNAVRSVARLYDFQAAPANLERHGSLARLPEGKACACPQTHDPLARFQRCGRRGGPARLAQSGRQARDL